MNVHVSYKAGKTPDVEREFQHQIQKLQRRLQVFKPELVQLNAVAEQENSHRATMSLNLRLPSGQMAVQRSGENPLAAVKSAFADLLSQVTKHKDMLRGHGTRKSLPRAGREARGGLPVMAPAPTPRRTKGGRPGEAHRVPIPAKPVPAAKTDEAAV